MDPIDLPLRDLHLPAQIGWWPMAPGWWLLLAIAASGIGYLLYRLYRQWQHDAPRRLALRELARIRGDYERGVDAVTLGKEMSELLRRAMLAYAPRKEVAGLTGERWLQWLDRGLDEKLFTDGPGRILESLPYAGSDQENADLDIDALTRAVGQRLRSPLPEVSR